MAAGGTDIALLPAYLAERVERLLGEGFVRGRGGVQALVTLASSLGIAFVDPARHRSWVDERVHDAVLHRSHHWRGLAEARAPIPMILFCPNCGERHIDQPDLESGWTNPPHRSHLCAACGHIWRPADVATVGVAELLTQGRVDRPFPARVIPAANDNRFDLRVHRLTLPPEVLERLAR